MEHPTDYHVTTMSAPMGALPLALARLGVGAAPAARYAIRRWPARVAAPAAVHGADRNPLSPVCDGLEAGPLASARRTSSPDNNTSNSSDEGSIVRSQLLESDPSMRLSYSVVVAVGGFLVLRDRHELIYVGILYPRYERNISNKISRGGFTAAFFFQVMWPSARKRFTWTPTIRPSGSRSEWFCNRGYTDDGGNGAACWWDKTTKAVTALDSIDGFFAQPTAVSADGSIFCGVCIFIKR